jgi:hypothetical protein
VKVLLRPSDARADALVGAQGHCDEQRAGDEVQQVVRLVEGDDVGSRVLDEPADDAQTT